MFRMIALAARALWLHSAPIITGALVALLALGATAGGVPALFATLPLAILAFVLSCGLRAEEREYDRK